VFSSVALHAEMAFTVYTEFERLISCHEEVQNINRSDVTRKAMYFGRGWYFMTTGIDNCMGVVCTHPHPENGNTFPGSNQPSAVLQTFGKTRL
jgi:hypothetical protein